MQNNKSYTIQETNERIQAYCAVQERCQWDIQRKMKFITNTNVVSILGNINDNNQSRKIS